MSIQENQNEFLKRFSERSVLCSELRPLVSLALRGPLIILIEV